MVVDENKNSSTMFGGNGIKAEAADHEVIVAG
jgi:hypothetical protein